MKKPRTLPEAAEFLRVSEKWLRGACKDGAPHVRMAEKLLFTEAHLEQILDRFEVKPTASASPAPRRRRVAAPAAEVVRLAAKTPHRLRNQA